MAQQPTHHGHSPSSCDNPNNEGRTPPKGVFFGSSESETQLTSAEFDELIDSLIDFSIDLLLAKKSQADAKPTTE